MPTARTNPSRACRALPKIDKNADVILAKTKPTSRHSNQTATTLHIERAQKGKPNFSSIPSIIPSTPPS